METYEKHEMLPHLLEPYRETEAQGRSAEPAQSALRDWRAIADVATELPVGDSYDGMSKATAVQERIDERMQQARNWATAHPVPGLTGTEGTNA
jgi:hypothetical protein